MRTKLSAVLLGLALLGLLAGGITIASASPKAPATNATNATNAWGMPAAATAAPSQALPGPDITTATTIVVISRNETQTDIDNPPVGPSQGDEGVVHSPLFNRAGTRVGTLDVQFQFTSLQPMAIQAVFTASLSKGQIAAQGVAGAGQTFTVGVTGGTGAYQNARGQVTVRFLANAVRLTYHLIP